VPTDLPRLVFSKMLALWDASVSHCAVLVYSNSAATCSRVIGTD
jgi:hypothetical protein